MCAADDEPDPVTLVRHAVLCGKLDLQLYLVFDSYLTFPKMAP